MLLAFVSLTLGILKFLEVFEMKFIDHEHNIYSIRNTV